VASYALKTYRRNNSIKRWELIEKLYGAFIGKGWYEFYERIKDGEQIDSSKDGKLLNKTLTLFDALNYFQTQGLLDKKAWEYVACEILNFALNNSVWEYMNNIKKPYVEKGFLVNELSPEEQSSYYNKAKNIPDERLQLKRAIAFCIYDNAKRE